MSRKPYKHKFNIFREVQGVGMNPNTLVDSGKFLYGTLSKKAAAEPNSSGAVEPNTTYEIRTHYRDDIGFQDVLVRGARRFNVRTVDNLDDLNRVLVIEAVERIGEGQPVQMSIKGTGGLWISK